MFTSKELKDSLQKQRSAAEERDAKRRAKENNLPYLELITVRTPTEFKAMSLIKEEEARKAMLVPVQVISKDLMLAVFDPNYPETKKLVGELGKKYNTSLAVASMTGLEHTWRHYEHIEEKGEEITGSIKINLDKIKEIEKGVKATEDLKKKIDGFASVKTSQILEIILGGALALRTSDIHFEAGKEKSSLRFRVDGVLHIVYDNFSSKTHRSLTTRIKLVSNLKLNIKSEPQDGRFTMSLPGRDIELRVSTIPAEYGETVVLRILDPSALKTKLEELGWREDDLTIIKKELKKPTGLVLNTGPTGSGKTTTLYAFLQSLAGPEIKIITIEDPIEYHIKGISQTQAEENSLYSFSHGLRAIVRQDPDVILVGEIRDNETAGIALQASLTGHKVFSTLHTNDAAGAIPRLIDLGADANAIGSGLNLVIAQRLVRVLCPHCKEKVEVDEKIRIDVDNFIAGLPKRIEATKYKDFEIYKAGSCENCHHLGYKGRMGIFELFLISEKMEELIHQNPTTVSLLREARKEGMVLMQEDGVLKALSGITTFDEIEKATGPIDWLENISP